MGFTFGYATGADKVEEKYSKRKLADSPILYKDKHVKISIVVDQRLSSTRVNALNAMAKRAGMRDIQILCPLRFDTEEKDFKSGVTDLYLNNSFDLENYIEKGTKILSMGRAIYYLTRSADLDVETFYDTLLNRTYFFDPIRQCRVYVVDGPLRVIGKDNFEHWNAKRVMKQCATEEFVRPKFTRKTVVIRDQESLEEMMDHNRDAHMVSIDTETSGFNHRATLMEPADRMLSLELCFDGKTGYHIPWSIVLENTRALSRYLSSKVQVYTNGKFDVKFLLVNGFRRAHLHIDHDIIQIRHTVNEMSKLGLKPQSFIYTNFGGYDFELDKYKKKYKVKSYADIPTSLLETYGSDDAVATFIACEEGLKDLDELDRLYPNPANNGWNLRRLYSEIRIPHLNNYLNMEIEGLYVDINELDNTSNELKQKIYSKTQELLVALRVPKGRIDVSSLSYEDTEDDSNTVKSDNFTMGALTLEESEDTLNINSNQQLGQYLEEDLGWRIYERDSAGFPNVNASTVARWRKDGYKEAKVIDELAKLQTLYGTFVGERKGPKGVPTGFYQYLRKHGEDDYRVHANFASCLAGSWRDKCNNPNLQNIPAHGEKAQIIKRHFTTKDESEIFYSEDFSGLQLRLLGVVTNDPVMRDIFVNRGGDMHSITAFGVFCRKTYVKPDISQECGYSLCTSTDPEGQKLDLDMYLKLRGKIGVLGQYRRFAKSINFGFAFSMAARTFAINFIKPEWKQSDLVDFIEENDLRSHLREHLHECGDVYTGLQSAYLKAKGTSRLPRAGFDVLEAIEYLKEVNMFIPFEDAYGFEEVEKLYDAYAITVGETIRKNFFETYVGLEKFGIDQKAYAEKHGYVRSIYGNFRRLPYLLYKGRDTNGSIWSNKSAIAVNTTIQSMEAIMMDRWINNCMIECKEKGLSARVFDKIHDASENFVPKDELAEYRRIKKYWATYPFPELNGIPMDTEANIADYWGTKGTTKQDFDGNEVSAWELWDLGPDVDEFLKEQEEVA